MSVETLEGGRRIFDDPRLGQMRVDLLMHLAANPETAPSKFVREYIKALEQRIIDVDTRHWREFAAMTWDQWDR